MIDPRVASRLLTEAEAVLRGRFRTRLDSDEVVVDLTREDGSVLWPNYASGPNGLLAMLIAEQRYLVEQEGQGSVAGASYLDKARERIRRASESGVG